MDQVDRIVERTLLTLQLERSRRFWRVVGVMSLLLLALVLWKHWQGDNADTGPHLALVRIAGLITHDQEALDVLKQLADDDAVKGVVAEVDSPGGTMVGGLDYYTALRRVAVKKPVVTVMQTTAASAGYMAAVAGDHVLTSPGTLTGSVGVLMPLVDVRGLAEKVGIRSDEVVSGNLKDVTSPLAQRDAIARGYLQGLVDSLNGVFQNLVQERRTLTPETLRLIKDGRAFSGVQAKELGLVDGLGDAEDARTWLNAKLGRKNKDALDLQTYELSEEEGWLDSMLHGQLNMGAVLGHWTAQALNELQGRSALHGVWAIAR